MSNFILSDLRELLSKSKVKTKIRADVRQNAQEPTTAVVTAQCRECGEYTTNVLVNDAYLCTNCSQNAEE